MDQSLESESIRIRREWAKNAAQDFCFLFPQHQAGLWELNQRFFVLVDADETEFNELKKLFHNHIRPITCPVSLVRELDSAAIKVDDNQLYSEELWLTREPHTVDSMNTLLHLATPGLPGGGVDFNHEIDAWIYKTPRALTSREQVLVESSMAKLGLGGAIQVEVFNPLPPEPQPLDYRAAIKSDVLKGSWGFKGHSYAARQLIAKDEDQWRNFIEKRGAGHLDPVPEKPAEFACLYNMSDRSDVRLSELLTLYDRIDIIPDRKNLNWIERHGLSIEDLTQLVSLGRCRVIFPYGAEHCRPDLMDGLASIGSMSPVLSRELAAKTIISGQAKDPLLYGPFNAKQRLATLHAIQKLNTHPGMQSLAISYGSMFARQHNAFMLNGAMASMSLGVSTHLAEILASSRGLDIREELCAAGAHVEWAMALGAVWIPRKLSDTYDETLHSHLVAGLMSRTFGKPVDPVTSRLHVMTDGLLAVSNVPPLEIARNFNGPSVTRFRAMTKKLMHSSTTLEEIQACVEQINDETQRFERRLEFLKRWRIDLLGHAFTAKAVGDTVDSFVGGGIASVIANMLLEVLKERVPPVVKDYTEDAWKSMIALALAPSFDALVSSRALEQLRAA